MIATEPRAALELRKRMQKPQRHRLLHGYPLAAAMPTADGVSPYHELRFDEGNGRGLLVGVLPHPFCNPAVAGCGFCTFPHEPGNAAKTTSVVNAVANEVRRMEEFLFRGLFQRKVTGLYFGGGTANLCEPEPFRELCKALADSFDLKDAEVTLEGVPAYFLRGNPRLLDVMRETLGARHYRVSMGIQTFDADRLKQTGRTAFGTPDTFREVVDLAHSLGFTASADLLFDLPGQTLAEMRADVQQAIDLGLDHVELYHLVLFAGLGTAWADDDDLLAGLPDNDRAAGNWRDLRGLMLASDYVQTSLTNFERKDAHTTAERFLYEDSGFRPDEFEIIGFGPSALSYVASRDFGSGVNVMNPTTAEAYTKAIGQHSHVWDKAFAYGPRDQRLLWLTRRLARLELPREGYRRLFGADMLDEFPEEFEAIREAGLVEVTADAVRPTPTGMFFADSIAAVLASPVLAANRSEQLDGKRRAIDPALLADTRENDNSFGHM
jgi:oxygen-independent coproporphyrinogen-3 oxidase